MASPLGPDDILKATFVITAPGTQTALISVHYLLGFVSGSPTDFDAAVQLDAIANSRLLPLMWNEASYRGCIVQKIQPLPIRVQVSSNAGAGNGTAGAAGAGLQVSGVGSFYTDLAGRSGRGRIYVPFPSSAHVDPLTGAPLGTYVVALANFIGTLEANATFGSGGNSIVSNLAIYHKATGTADIVTRTQAQHKFGTQKRRGNYGRTNVSPLP